MRSPAGQKTSVDGEPLRAGAICRCRGLRPETSGYALVVAEPVRGREWLTVMPLGLPPAVRPHPLRPQLPLASVQRLVAGEQWPGCFCQDPLLVGDQISTVARADLEEPIGQIGREQLLRVRQLGGLALGLNLSDLSDPPRRPSLDDASA
jgi:hypothetical protein